MIVEGEVNNKIVKLLIDTGASISVIRMGISTAEIEPAEFKVRGVTGDELRIIGSQRVKIKFDSEEFELKFSVCKEIPLPCDIILGLDNLKLVGAKINSVDKVVYVGNSVVLECVDTNGRHADVMNPQSEHSSPTECVVETPRDLESDTTWLVLTDSVTVLPPRSQYVISARLKCRGIGPPDQVLIEPAEIDVSGVYAARVVSLVRKNDKIGSSPDDNILYCVCIKLLNTCSESIKLLKGTIVGRASVLCPFCLVCPGQAGVVSERILAANDVTNIVTESIRDVPRVGGNDLVEALQVDPVETTHREINVGSTTESFTVAQCARWHLLEELRGEELNRGEISSSTDVCLCENSDHCEKFVGSLIDSKLDHQDFKELILDKLAHLDTGDRNLVFPTIWKYRDVFYDGITELGCRSKITHKINTGNAKAIRKYPYRVPYALQPVMQGEISKLLERGVIQPSASPWSAPCLLVTKRTDDPDKPKYRLVTDFRSLNSLVPLDPFPLPNISETLDKLGQNRYFSLIDLASGFHQVPIAPEDQEKTGFSTVDGHYEYKTTPFGLNNSPATFQRLMNLELAGLIGIDCMVYIDDILIFSSTIQQHCERLSRVFDRLRAVRLFAQPEKCFFLQKEVRYLGYIISEEGYRADPDKVKSVENFPRPTNVREIRSFLGLCNYYRKMIDKFSEIALPMTVLTRKNVTFNWSTACEDAFQKLKQALTTEPLLVFPDFSKEFIVSTDASASAIAGVLSQRYDEGERPVAYYSRQTTKAEAKYSSSELECLSLVTCIKHWRCYLYGRHFTVITDHIALTYLLRIRDASARLSRWALKLSEYSFTCIHKPGRAHVNADVLSRAISGITAVPEFPRDAILADQKTDHFCTEVYKTIRKGKSDCFKQDTDGLLYKRDGNVSKLIVPKAMVNKLIFSYHDPPYSGHQGYKRTSELISRKYYWPNMIRDIETYVSRCTSCATRKRSNISKAPMAIFESAQSVFEVCSMDIVGPLPLSRGGNKYLLTFIDHLSRYAEAIPIPDQSAATIANAFVRNVVLRHSAPQRLLSDLGKNFISSLFQEVSKLLGIKRMFCTPYKPNTNGLIERFHRTLADIISHYVDKDSRNWDVYVDYALAAYRNTKHSSTLQTPFFLFYGREFRLPIATDLECSLDVKPSVSELRQKLEEAFSVAKQATERSRRQNKIRYDRGKKLVEYNIGDLVYHYQPSIKLSVGSKYAHPWVGPYRIVTKLSDRNYVLKVGESSVTVNVDRIKPYRGIYVEDDVLSQHDVSKSRENVDGGTGNDSVADNSDSSDDEAWLFVEPMIERVELPVLEDQDNVHDTLEELNESSEIDDHRDVDYEPELEVSPVIEDGPAYRTRAKVRL